MEGKKMDDNYELDENVEPVEAVDETQAAEPVEEAPDESQAAEPVSNTGHVVGRRNPDLGTAS